MNKLSRVVTGLAVTGSLLFGAYDYHHNKQPITVEYQEMHDLYYKYNFALGCNTYGFTTTKTIKEAETMLKRLRIKNPKPTTKENPEEYVSLKDKFFDESENLAKNLFSIRDIDTPLAWQENKIMCEQIEVSMSGIMDNLRERYLYF